MENHLVSCIRICTKVKMKDHNWAKVIDKCQNFNFHNYFFSVFKITFLTKVFILIVRKTILIAVVFFLTYILIDCTNVFFYSKYICVMIVFWNPWNSNMYFFILFFLHSGWLLILPFHEWDSSFLLVWICCYLTIIRFYRK